MTNTPPLTKAEKRVWLYFAVATLTSVALNLLRYGR